MATDLAWIGHIGTEAVAAAALAGMILSVGVTFAAGVTSAVGPLAAQACGAADGALVRRSVRMGLWARRPGTGCRAPPSSHFAPLAAKDFSAAESSSETRPMSAPATAVRSRSSAGTKSSKPSAHIARSGSRRRMFSMRALKSAEARCAACPATSASAAGTFCRSRHRARRSRP
ncbi:MATE family efflux transporter [Bradyrhizobium sp. BR 1432]|uniref:MATE family efflux transporter n=1 Tax=Bradyrhizobium sp. BR 1432 TaxID=3447966 RepID=UPI003EE5811F